MPWEDLRFNPHFPRHNALTVTPLARPSSSRQRFFLLAKFFQKAKLKIKNVKKDFFEGFYSLEMRRKKRKKWSDSYYIWFHCVAKKNEG
jgi:hypothetical protein